MTILIKGLTLVVLVDYRRLVLKGEILDAELNPKLGPLSAQVRRVLNVPGFRVHFCRLRC